MAKIIINGADFSDVAIGNKYFSELDCTIQGVGINCNTGEVAPDYSSWASTDFLDIANFSSLKVVTDCNGNSFGFAIYDSSKTYIDGQPYGGTSGVKNITMELPDGTCYLRFCTKIGDTPEKYAHYTLTK